jgi:hypothetical protein
VAERRRSRRRYVKSERRKSGWAIGRQEGGSRGDGDALEAGIGRARYLVVFNMARDFLSVLATSCDCERTFSKARRTITCDRNALTGVSIEALQLQRNWLQRRVVQSELADLQDCLATQTSAVGGPAAAGLDTDDAPATDDPAASRSKINTKIEII